MKKNTLVLLVVAILCFTGKGFAQTTEPCGTTEMYNKYKLAHPEIADYERQLAEQTLLYYKNHPGQLDHFLRTTGDTQYYDIPVVFHVMHDYGSESTYLTDNYFYGLIASMNTVYAGLNADLASVIPPFQKYIGKTTIRFHMATVDPNGNPTHGITHHRTYLTYGGDDQVKMDQWAPTNYYNIWFENVIGRATAGGIILAYANFPAAAASYPYNDGVIARYDVDAISNYTIQHETGHYFNLLHPWNNNGAGGGQILSGCGDDDVDDTPPTQGHFSTCNLYDTLCAVNYYKIYTDISGHDSLVNYPDTTNTQTIMDYSSCTVMFTKGQVQRMYAAINSNVGGRSNLWDPTNLINTGVTDASGNFIPRLDLKPIPEFSAVKNSAGKYSDRVFYFTPPGVNVSFHNQTWNDTLTSLTWNFSNGASVPTSNSTSSFYDSFSVSGWVDLQMTAVGNNSGTTTVDWPRAVFVADRDGTSGVNYVQEFSGADTIKWPYFNYYNNEFHWQLDTTVGLDDHYCMKYVGFDSRIDPFTFTYPYTGTPLGDFDDLFTVPMDLSSFTDTCNLNFWFASASRSSSSTDINDTLEIDYATKATNSINPFSGITWKTLKVIAKGDLVNNGASATAFTPSMLTQWSPMTAGVPADARTPYTIFRFRYRPNVGADGVYSSGNNYYMDRLSFNRTPASVSTVKLTSTDVAVVPNPTNGDAYVVIKDANNAAAKIVVTDVTGKVVYTTSQQISGGEAHILIPHTAIAVTGIYMVQTTTGNQSQTKKLVVY